MDTIVRNYTYIMIAKNLCAKDFQQIRYKLENLDDKSILAISTLQYRSVTISLILGLACGLLAGPAYYVKKYVFAIIQTIVIVLAYFYVFYIYGVAYNDYDAEINLCSIIFELLSVLTIFAFWIYNICCAKKWAQEYNYHLITNALNQ